MTAPTLTYDRFATAAVHGWRQADQMTGQASVNAAIALAIYIQDIDKISGVFESKKKLGNGDPAIVETFNFALSQWDNYRNNCPDDRRKNAANIAVYKTVFGGLAPNTAELAAFKMRMSRCYPAALQLVVRSNELQRRVVDLVTVNDDKIIVVPAHVTIPSIEIDRRNEIVPLTLASLAPVAHRAPRVTGSVATPASAPAEATVGVTRDTKSPAPAPAPLSTAREAVICEAATAVILRLTAIMAQKGEPLTDREVDKLLGLSAALTRYTAWRDGLRAEKHAAVKGTPPAVKRVANAGK